MPEPLDLAADLLPVPGGRRILGLAGPPGAGKSTLATAIVDGLNVRFGTHTAAYVPLDGFHLSNAQLARLGTADRKGAIFTFDVGGYLALLRRLLDERTEDVYVPDYDRRLHEPIAARHVVPAGVRLIVTEGNYMANPAVGWREITGLAAELWYVDAPAEERLRRLVKRHSAGNRDPEAARQRATHNDIPNGELVLADQTRCHRTVPGTSTRP
ncbi:MAG: nucleoside/nucleotide kinase family protein [Stackebrandtia sp.]